jgi:hypothetical protein
LIAAIATLGVNDNMARAGYTATGMYYEYGRSDEYWDFLLADFDIDSEHLKSDHDARVKQAAEFIKQDYAARATVYEKIFFNKPVWTIWVKGFASNTFGGKVVGKSNDVARQHNSVLSAKRATAVQEAIQDWMGNHILVQKNRIVYSVLPRGFLENTEAFAVSDTHVNSAYCRSVRVALTRPGSPPVDQPIPQVNIGDTEWRIRMLGDVGAGKYGVGTEVIFFQIGNKKESRIFAYGKSAGGSVGVGPPISYTAAGKPKPFTTSKPVEFQDFEGDADYGQGPAAGPLSVTDTLLDFRSFSMLKKGVQTSPRKVVIDTGATYGVTLFSSTSGTLKMVADSTSLKTAVLPPLFL